MMMMGTAALHVHSVEADAILAGVLLPWPLQLLPSLDLFVMRRHAMPTVRGCLAAREREWIHTYVNAMQEADGRRNKGEAAEELSQIVARAAKGRDVEGLLSRRSLQCRVHVGQRLERRGHTCTTDVGRN
jgi:hypothetical protein